MCPRVCVRAPVCTSTGGVTCGSKRDLPGETPRAGLCRGGPGGGEAAGRRWCLPRCLRTASTGTERCHRVSPRSSGLAAAGAGWALC